MTLRGKYTGYPLLYHYAFPYGKFGEDYAEFPIHEVNIVVVHVLPERRN
jgi:hypothetical protein